MARRGNIDFEIVNLEQFLADLERVEARATEGMSAALRQEADHMMDRADILVPVRTGKLKGSRFVGIVGRWSRGLEIKFGYATPYALYQHYGHYEHDDGQRLFLERPVKYAFKGSLQRMKLTLLKYLRYV